MREDTLFNTNGYRASSSRPTVVKNLFLLGAMAILVLLTAACQPEKLDYSAVGVTEDGQAVFTYDVDDDDSYENEATIDAFLVNGEPVQAAPVIFFDREPQLLGCDPLDSRHCFRIDPAGTIEESTDAGLAWDLIWQVDPNSLATRMASQAKHRPEAVRLHDLAVGNGGDFAVAFGSLDVVTRTANGTWINPAINYRRIPSYFILQIILTMLILHVVASVALGSFNTERLGIWLIFAGLNALVITAGYRSAHESTPLALIVSIPLLLIAFIWATIESRVSNLEFGAAIFWRFVFPFLATAACVAPVALWRSQDIFGFEPAARAAITIAIGSAFLIFFLARRKSRLVRLFLAIEQNESHSSPEQPKAQ